MSRARTGNGWAIPRTPNAQHNWGLLGGWFRPAVEMPADGKFYRDHRGVLGEGLSTEEEVALCKQHNVAMIPTATIHDAGPTNGNDGVTSYHGAGGVGRGPHLGVQSAKRFGREKATYLKSTGVEVEAFAFGNELAYAPSIDNSDYVDYLDRVIDMALAYRTEVRKVFPNIEVILGCNHGKPVHNGRKTLVQRVLDRGVGNKLTVDIHGNGSSISDVVDEIEWCKGKGLKVVVLEDRNEGPDNDAYPRTRAFSDAGAHKVGQFGSRNVNADGSNPTCRWGVQQSGKKKRNTGAAWTCAGWQPDEYGRLWDAAVWCGCNNEGPELPDDTDGDVEPPVDHRFERPMAAVVQRILTLYGLGTIPMDTLMEDEVLLDRLGNYFRAIEKDLGLK